jgi:hypothetical protein
MHIAKFYEWCYNKGYWVRWGLWNTWFGVIRKVLEDQDRHKESSGFASAS